MTSNATWSVHAPGNVRGIVSFSMDAVDQTHSNPNCTSPDYCAQVRGGVRCFILTYE